ncbi:MAG: hypothetical protein N3F06_01175, partial [Nitrososphaerales archaeon]|nr:hypothetical protein [Nitrososphaerales archaeon]
MIDIGITHLENDENGEATKIFRNIIKIDSGFDDLNEITDTIKHLASQKRPTCLKLLTQKALIGLGIIYARKGEMEIAEDCILNGAYNSRDGGILFLAGTF